MPSERLQVILELVTGNYERNARSAAVATGSIDKAAGTVTSTLGRMIGPAAIGGAIIGLANMAVKAGENADRLMDLRAQTGLTLDDLQEWEFVAKTAGAATDVFADAVKTVIKNLNETEGATGTAAGAYDTLGIRVLDASGKLRDAGTITQEAFDKLAGMDDITARNALAQDIFGKKWEETISVLDLGSDAIANARKEAHELGVVLSGEQLEGADNFRETFEKLKTTLSATLMQTLAELAPTLTDIAKAILEVVKAAQPVIALIGEKPGAGEGGGIGFVDEFGDVNWASFWLKGIVPDDVLESWNDQSTATREAERAAHDYAVAMADATKDDTSQVFLEAAGRARYMADTVKDEVLPALNDLAADGREAARGLLDAKLAAIEAGAAFREDLAAEYATAALSIDKSSGDIGLSLDELETNLLENLTAHATFTDNLAILYEAGYSDLADFLAGEGADKVAGATASLVADMERAASLDNAIAQAELDAQAWADRVADTLEDSRLRLVDVARSIGIDLADGLEAGLSTLDLQDLLGIALGAPGLGPVQGGTTKTTSTSGAGGAAGYGSGNRAFGGPTSANQMYMVGERGPEMFVSGTAGNIIPNDILRAMGGGVSITVNHPNTTNLAQDVQLATLYASVKNLVEGY